MAIYREGFNNPLEGAKRFKSLQQEIMELEAHECEIRDFYPCAPCDNITTLTHELNEISFKWARAWSESCSALADIMKLVDEGIIVRNTSCDGDFQAYVMNANRLVVALSKGEKAIK